MVATLMQEGQEFVIKAMFNKVTVVNEVQTVTITGSPTAGNFKLTHEGQETANIAFNAAASAVQSALEALSTIGTGNVSVTGAAGGPYTVTFQGTLAGTPVPEMTATHTLTGGTSPAVAVATTTQGAGTIPQYYYVGLSQADRATLGEAAGLAAAQEVTGTGYARVRVKTDTTDWTPSFTGGFWQVLSKQLSFSATGSDWTISKSIFLATTPDNSGKLVDVRDFATSFTLGNGQIKNFDLTEMFAAAA